MFRKWIPSKMYNWRRKNKNDDEGENIRLKSKNRKKFRRMILLKRIQTNMWENIQTPKDDINVVIHEKHHIETSSNRERSATF